MCRHECRPRVPRLQDGSLPKGRRRGPRMAAFSLKEYDLHVAEVYRNPVPALLYEHAIRFDLREKIARGGALVAYSGAKTGRSPRDKRIVQDPATERDVWWGTVNLPLEQHSF